MGPLVVLAWALAAAPLPVQVGPPAAGPVLVPTPRSAPIPGIGLRLARALRRQPDAPHEVLIRGMGPAHIRAGGGVVLATIEPITAAIIPGRDVAEALARRGADLELPAPLRPALDVSRLLIRADRTDFGLGFVDPLRGQGVVIGLYDSGIDLSHPDLRRIDGHSRVIAAWDQDSDVRCDAARIDVGECRFGDEDGHGTHVASIAAGSGPLHRGIAPEASVAIVKSSAFTSLIPALAFLEDAAKGQAAPLVVNLSLGGHVGPHDGTSPEAQAIDGFRHLTIVAAGNEAGEAVHAGATLGPGAMIDVAINLEGATKTIAVVDAWGATDATLAIALVAMKDQNLVWTSGALGPGTPGRTVPIAIAGGPTVGEVELDAEPEKNSANGRPHVGLAFTTSVATDVTFAVRMTGSGRFDAWIDAPTEIVSVPRFADHPVLGVPSEILGDDALSLSDLASAEAALAISAVVSRNVVDGERVSGARVGALASFSSRGPTLDPARTGPKPDLTAPGAFVVAANSRTGDPGGPLYRVRAGTSMAVPHVAGAAAVLLGHAPTASIDDLRRWLTTTAAPPPDDDARWGSGTLDLAAAAVAAGAPTQGCGCRTTSAAGSPIWAAVILVAWCLRRRG